ncbi:MAG: hypothetical protein ACYC0X_24215 [Pirellulaceae bacterium]
MEAMGVIRVTVLIATFLIGGPALEAADGGTSGADHDWETFSIAKGGDPILCALPAA